jgi:hypothetical protein
MMIYAPFPEKESESVREYNSRHIGKAWAIVAMQWQGETYCADCAGDWPTYENDLIESPHPVFSSDEYDEMTCGYCTNHLR